MKKIFLMLALAMTVSMASAWEKRPDEGVFLLAKKHLSPEAKSMVEKYLGESYADDVFYLRNLEAKKQPTRRSCDSCTSRQISSRQVLRARML